MQLGTLGFRFGGRRGRDKLLASTVLTTITPPATGPAYAAVVARPVPTGTVHTVTTSTGAAAIAAMYATLPPGDCLEFDDGTYLQPDCFPNGYNRPGVIIRAKNRGAYDADPMGGGSGAHHARFTRKTIFEYDSRLGGTTSTISAANVTVHDIKHQMVAGLWPADNVNWSAVCPQGFHTSYWGYISLASGTTNWNVLYNEFSMGYGPTHTQFDPTLKYPDCNSPDKFDINPDGTITQNSASGSFTGWNDATWLTYNRLLNGPTAVVCPSTRPGAGTLYGNYIHDITRGTKGLIASNILVQHNWYERSYHDFNDFGRGDTTTVTNFGFDQNVIIDPLGHQFDNGNPHVDSDQMFWSFSPKTTVRVYGLRRSRNIVMGSSPNTRAMVQNGFWQMAADHYASLEDVVSVAPKIRENLAIMLGTSHGMDLAVSEDAYVRGNEWFHPATLGSAYAPVSAYLSVDGARGISTANLDNKICYADNVAEADVTPSAPAPIVAPIVGKINNVTLGIRTARAIPEATVFTGSAAGWPSTPYAAFQYRQKQAGYLTTGIRSANVVDFLMGPMDWTGERPFLGFIDLSGQTSGATITSNPAWVHGGNAGASLAIIPAAGTQWRTLSATDRSTQVQAWSSTPGTVHVDSEYVQIKGPAPAQGTTADLGPSLAGVHMPWNVAAASTALFPAIKFNGTSSFARTGTTQLANTDSQKMTVAFSLLLPKTTDTSYPASNIRLLSDANGAVFQVLVQTPGKVFISMKNSAGTIVCSWSTTADMRDGLKHTYQFSVDLSQANAAAGFRAVIDGVVSGIAPSAFVTGGQIWTSRAATNYYVGGATTSQLPNGSQLGFMYVSIADFIDLSVAANSAKFNADTIGSTGTGPTGTQPIIFLVGNAAQWNNGGLRPTGSQWGSGLAWPLIGTGPVTDAVNGQAVWA